MTRKASPWKDASESTGVSGAGFAAPSGKRPDIPDHELIKPIGRGSYGEVWLGRTRTGSYRAIKVVYRHTFEADKPYEREFTGIKEFEPISRSHPAQIDILHVGRNDEAGYFYYIMELADDESAEPEAEAVVSISKPQPTDTRRTRTGSTIGRVIHPETYEPNTLRSVLRKRGRLPVEECLQIATSLAEALEHLHSHGLVHRDIKPSNVIFVNGRPKLADIGLVARTDATLSFVGTEGYLPPEGPGKPQADIYSLGKVLYEMATGKDRNEFPEAPSIADSEADHSLFLELNEVVLHACESLANLRYHSATELIADLVMLRQGRSVRALRLMERRFKTVARVGVISLLVAGLATGAYFFQRHQTRKAQASAARETRLRQQADAALLRLERQRVEELFTAGEDDEALARLAQQVRSEPENSVLIERLLSALMYRQYPLPVFDVPGNWAQFSPDGTKVAVAFGRLLRLLDARNGNLVREFHLEGWPCVLRFLPGGIQVVVASNDGTATVWNLGETDSSAGAFRHPGTVNKVEFSPDGRLILSTSERTAFLWDARTGDLIHATPQHDSRLISAHFRPDGTQFLTASGGRIETWDVLTGRRLKTLDDEWLRDWEGADRAKWSPNGDYIVYIGSGGGPRIWHLETGRIVKNASGQNNDIRSVEFSADGSRLLTACADETARLWDAKTGLPVGPPMRHSQPIWCAVFSPNGRCVATGMDDKTLRIWDSQTGKPLTGLIPHGGRNVRVRFSSDGERLLATGEGRVGLWDVGFGKARPQLLLHPPLHYGVEGVAVAHFDSKGERLLTGVTDKLVSALWTRGLNPPPHVAYAQIVNLRHPDSPPVRLLHNDDILSAVFSPDEKLVLTVSRDGTAGVWRSDNGAPVAPFLQNEGPVRDASFSHDGSRIVLALRDQPAEVWDLRSGQKPLTLPHGPGAWRASFSPDDRFIATASRDPSVVVWDAATGERVASLEAGGTAWLAEFSPDSQFIVSCFHKPRSVLQLWRALSGEPVPASLTHDYPITAAHFSRDASRLLTASMDGTAKLWELPAGRLLSQFNHEADVWQVRFGPKEAHVVTASGDQTARVWDVRTGLPASEPLAHDEEVLDVELSPDGHWLATACFDGVARVWEVPVASRPAPAWLPRLAEAVAGDKVSVNGIVMFLYLTCPVWTSPDPASTADASGALGFPSAAFAQSISTARSSPRATVRPIAP